MARAGPSKPASSGSSKPYERPAPPTKSKGKSKDLSGSLPSRVTSAKEVNIGAPAQLGQSSRRGKKAWRKNIDITAEEVALEQAREEERVTGGRLTDKKDGDLFTIDVVGDVEVAQRMRRAHKPLRSLAVLSERSAVPSLTSRVNSSSPASSSHKLKLSPYEKARLRRIARKTVIGSDGTGLGSADISVVAAASRVLRDAWVAPPSVDGPIGGFGEETMRKIEPKAPITLQRQREIRRAQVEEGLVVEVPGAGTSYNPSQEAHERLLEKAVEQELGKLAGEAREEMRAAILGEVVVARRNASASAGEFAPGMIVGPGDLEGDEDDEANETNEEEDTAVKKTTKRKTQAQRNKAARKKELARLEKIAVREKNLHKSIGGVSNLKKLAEQRAKEAAEAERARRLAKREKERMGLEGGEKVGKHRVKKADVAVQLGEDLAESLRQVKPEGNLFKDRFLALQKRALIEPRVPQLPKRKARKLKEYEKHAYKRFV